MKRTNRDFENSIDGNQFKKIKKLAFQLDNDEKEDLPEESNKFRDSQKTKKPITIINSDDEESQKSDSDDEIEHQDDNETMNDQDREALDRFFKPDLAKDIISEMKDAKEEVANHMGVEEFEDADWEEFNQHFNETKDLMVRYKKGRLFPKSVKVLPQVDNWCYILDKLDFPAWSQTAVQYMTEQFKAKGAGVEIYYKHFLLPYIRANISEKKRLDDLLYRTLQGALFRRREFMTGILLPWCADNISGREAEILGNVLRNSTVKVDVAAPVITVVLTTMPFSRETLIVLQALLEKKYNLPYLTIGNFVDYFCRAAVEDFSQFYNEHGKMAVLWHQALNLFVSLYYPHLTEEQTDRLFHLCTVQFHEKITDSTKAFLKMVPKSENLS